MARMRCDRFPAGDIPIRIASGAVVTFVDGRAEVDEETATALLAVPESFQISREDAPEPSAPERPANNASTEAWATYAVARGASPEDIEGANRKALIEQWG